MAAKRTSPVSPFRGFGPKGLEFLENLENNQNREWFEANRDDYERELREPLTELTTALGFALAIRGIDIGSDPKRAMFRIHRDVRFAKDKRPYKTHVSAALTRDGEKLSPGMLYVHIDPKESFAASGFYRCEPPQLTAIRRRMAERPKEILAIVADLKSAGLDFRDDEEPLKRTPRGFEAVEQPEIVRLLRLKSLIVMRPISRKLLADGGGLIDALVAFAGLCHPLLRFGWAAIAGVAATHRSPAKG